MLRWRIACLVSAAIAISYLDRQSLPVAVAAIQRDIPLTNFQFGALASTFNPTQYRDEYRDCVMDMIRRKAGGEIVATKAPPAKPVTKAKDLTEALRASLEHVKRKRKAEPGKN